MTPQTTQETIITYAGMVSEHAMRKLQSANSGLSQKEAKKRIVQYGKNKIADQVELHIVIQFLHSFKNPIVLLLIIVSVISFFLRESANAVIIILMVLLSAVLNFFQEYKANRAAEKLKNSTATLTTVIRNGISMDILREDVVPGDIVELNSGDLVPADARILEAKDCFVNESTLSGESFPAEKNSSVIDSKTADITTLSNILFAGTSIVTGQARAVVIVTGSSTQFGKLAQSLQEKSEDNDFTKGVTGFSYFILRIIMGLVLIIFFTATLVRHDIVESFMFAIAVAVGLAPEFLPMIMTVTMSRGSVNMAKKGVIVKKLTAIPSLGSMDTLATDKTGTLTEAKIKLVRYIDIAKKNSPDVLLFAYLNSSFESGISNPLDDAVRTYKKIDITSYSKIDEVPYDFVRKKMSVVVADPKDTQTMITKGAPEEIMNSCSTYMDDKSSARILGNDIRLKALDVYKQLSQEGFRVLAVAVKNVHSARHTYTKNDENDMELMGFVAFLDPPKEGTRQALDQLEELGIELKVITGDNELVTRKICRDVGITVKGMLLGHEIDSLTDEALSRKVTDTTIFARCSPQQKTRIIRALKTGGHTVGYLGDGINDASPLVAADVGISVTNAVDVAKESADLILTHKSLDELAGGVIEGRKTFGNTMKYIMMGLSSNFGNMFSVLGAVIFIPFLPMLPLQILLNNFLYDLSQIAIPTDNVDREYTKSPKKWDIKFIRTFMLSFGPISSIYDFASYAVLYFLYQNQPSAFQTGWFMESLATQTFVIHIIRTRFTPILKSNASIWLWLSTVCVVCIGWIIPRTQLGKIFGFTPLPVATMVILAGIVVVYLINVEVVKTLFYSHRAHKI